MTDILDSILKSRDITLPTKVCIVKAMIFPAVMYRCERCIIKKAEHQKIDAFELWCWRRLLIVLLRSNQSILKEINPEYSLEGLILKLKLQYFGHLMWRANSLERHWYWERLKVGREGDHRGWDGWMASLTQWIWVWASSGRWWRTGKPGVLWSMGLQRVRHDWETEQQQEGAEKGPENIFESTVAENFPHMGKDTVTQVQEVQRAWYRRKQRGTYQDML